MLSDHDKRTVLLAYRTDKLEQAVPPMQAEIADLQSTRKHFAKVASYVAAFIGVVFGGIGLVLQNAEAIARVIE